MYSFCWFNSFTIYLSAIFVWVLHVWRWQPDSTQQWSIVFLIRKLLPYWSDLLICSSLNWSEGSKYFFHFQLLLCSMSPISPIFWGEQVSLSHSMPSCFYLFGYMICMKRPNKWMSSCCVSLLFFAYLVWLTFCSDLGNALVLDFLCSVFWRESWFVRPLYLISLAGHPALIGRHRPFLVTHRAAERWLHHMRQALDTTESIDADSKTKMMNFFRSV